MQFAFCNASVIAVCLLAAGATVAADFRTPPETKGAVTAWLEVRIADRTEEPGLAEVTLLVSVEGPPGLEVRKAEINDAVSGWEATVSEPTTHAGDKFLWTQTITLKQTKPGQVPLPEVRVQFREGAMTAWETFAWPNLLRQVLVKPAPVEVAEPPLLLQSWRGRLQWAAAGIACAGAVFWIVRRLRRTRPQPLTPEERAVRELDAASALVATEPVAACAFMADTVRGFLAERWQLPATCRTTAEFLDAMKQGVLPEEQCATLQEFFERCDLVKFAGVRPPPEECQRTAELARQVISMNRESPLVISRNAEPQRLPPTRG